MGFRSFIWRMFRIALIVYVGACIGLVLSERHMVYLPYPGPKTPQEANLKDYTRATFTASDGAAIPYWEYTETTDPNAPILLYFHGNGGGLYAFTPALQFLATTKLHIIAMEYRGYPSAPHGPSQTALVGDATALYDDVHRHYPQQKIILWGYSLGTGVATQLASARHVDALVLEAPFTATVDRAAQLFPLIPVHALMRDQFRSRDVIVHIHTPLFIMHGDDDQIIPEPMGEALYELAAEPKTFHHYAHAGHLDLITTPAYGDAVAFIRSSLHAASH